MESDSDSGIEMSTGSTSRRGRQASKPRRSPNRRSRKRSPRRRTARSAKSPAKYVSPGGKVKFYDLIAKRPFHSSDYEVVTRITHGRNGRRKITSYVVDNPTPRADGKHFKNWKIVKNEAA
jgi:hypothetical protein